MNRYLSLIAILFSFQLLNCQTVVMNEISNGPSGNMEYVEFVVVDTNVVYNCVGVTLPPTIDIRGWIFDDNSGYHGNSGVASGCIRFSNNPIWANIPVGTIILIYNDLDPNTSLPPIDTLMSDANCRLVVPVNKVNWFDRNETTPGAVACSYPTNLPNPWLAAGNWSTTLFANGGDCARVVNTSGCEVFSVCWGSASSLTLIYFANSAQDRVYYFANTNNNDATNQSNWINGCADPGACGSNTQTPGAPNNAANASWINSMNNNCTPIPPLSASINPAPGVCPCSASAAVTVTGSIPPYSYTWSPAPGFGQGTASAGGLCSGTYTCVVQSLITNCTQTLITNVNAGTVSTIASNTGSYCEGATIQLNTSPATSYTWAGPGGFSSALQNPSIVSSNTGMSGIYTVNVILGGCLTTATTIVNVAPSPIIISTNTAICTGASTTLNATGAQSYVWNPGGIIGNSITVSPITNQNYTITGTDVAGCSNTAIASVSVNSNPTLSVNNLTICSGQIATLTASGANNYTWMPSGITGSQFTISAVSNFTANVLGANGTCSSSASAYIDVLSPPIISVNNATICSGQSATLFVSGANSYTWNNGTSGTVNIVNPVQTSTYSVVGYSMPCNSTSSASVIVNPLPNIVLNSINTCLGKPLILNSAGGTNYVWNGPDNFTSNSATVTIPVTNLLHSGNYTINVIDNNGCSNRQSLFVEINKCACEVFIPEGFSPNNDGAHDAFVVSCIENKEASVQIFNRWGNLVYTIDKYNNDWSGKCNTGLLAADTELPSGTYYYIIKISDEDNTRTGFLTLWR